MGITHGRYPRVVADSPAFDQPYNALPGVDQDLFVRSNIPAWACTSDLAATGTGVAIGTYVFLRKGDVVTNLTFVAGNTALATGTAGWHALYDASGNLLAFNDDASTATNNASLRVFAPSGDYFLVASSATPAQTGAYQLSSSGLPGNTGCGMYWVIPNVTIQGSVTTGDCNSEGYLSDGYFVMLRPGQTLTVEMGSTAMDAYLGLYNLGGSLVTSDDDGAGSNNARLTYTYSGTTPTAFYIDAGTAGVGQTGTYTLTVTRN